MKILIVAPKDIRRLPIAESISNEFKNFGHENKIFVVDSFYESCSYFQRKIYKLGYKHSEKIYNENLMAELSKMYAEFQPNFILILDGTNVPPPIQEFLTRYKTVLWLWDSFKRFEHLTKFTSLVKEIFCFEYDDIEDLRQKNIPAHYLPLGANEKIYFPAECEKDIDISFIGWQSKERLEILEKVCKRARQKNWTVKIGGPFHDNKYFWKKYLFGRRNKNLAKFLENRMFEPEEVAALYRRSKICLNINVSMHKSLNPRTFEICATKSFQLMNSGQNSCGFINLETDLATFDNAEDLLEKIEFYLANDELREKIAENGYNSVMKNCTIKKSVERLLAESEIVRSLK